MKTAERNSTTCECIFHQFAVKNVNVNVVITIYCQHNWIFLRQKKKIISIHYLTGQNRGLSGLQNIWPVIMTGNLLSVICSPDPESASDWIFKQEADWMIYLPFAVRGQLDPVFSFKYEQNTEQGFTIKYNMYRY